MPEELRLIADRSKSLSRTGNPGHYQGADACLEEINKQGREWVPGNGVPTDTDWLKIFRNLDKLEKISLYKESKLKSSSMFCWCFGADVNAVKPKLRQQTMKQKNTIFNIIF